MPHYPNQTHSICFLPTWDTVPGNPNTDLTPVQTADNAICRLLADPKQWEILRRVDVILLDKMGQVSSQLLSILDMQVCT
jgi:hypothetical protein